MAMAKSSAVEILEAATKLKQAGNERFKGNKYLSASVEYTNAIARFPSHGECPPDASAREWREHLADAVEEADGGERLVAALGALYSNRAFCNLRMENMGAAIQDASRAIELNFKKAHYRRGAAHFALGHLGKALKDFAKCKKYFPADMDAKRKWKETREAKTQQAFFEAIEASSSKPPSTRFSPDSFPVASDYSGPQFPESGITVDYVEALKTWFSDQKLVDKRSLTRTLLQVIALFRSMPPVVDVQTPTTEGDVLTVCGDVHGQYYDVLNIFSVNGVPTPTHPYLFNGDFVDRGSFSCEVIILFFSYKLLYPDHFHLTRGNHESINMNMMYGFQGEVKAKYGHEFFELFTEAFDWLPLAMVLHGDAEVPRYGGEPTTGRVFVTHGGLFSQDDVKLDEIRKIKRDRQPPDEGLMCEMLWSDPQHGTGRAPSQRGVGVSFGPDVTLNFLKTNGLDYIVRSHEMKMDGVEEMHDGSLVTIFSAPDYCDQMGNKGAFIHFDRKLKPKITQFDAVPHPEVRPMQYASGMAGMLGGGGYR